MAALGCLVPLVLTIAGLIAGAAIGEGQGAAWGALAGFVLGCVVPGMMLAGLIGARRR